MIHNFNAAGFDSLCPRYKGGRPPVFTLRQRDKALQELVARNQAA